jgi:hypothetical protein
MSSEQQEKLLLEPYVDNDAQLAKRLSLTERYLGTVPIVAEYHRIDKDAALWLSTGDGVPEAFTLSGRDPYEIYDAPIFSFVIRNESVIDLEGRCLRREIVLLVCPKTYEESHLLSLWRLLDERFPAPKYLRVRISANRGELQREMMGDHTMRAIYSFALGEKPFVSQCEGSASGSSLFLRSLDGAKQYYFDDGSGRTWVKFPEP